MSDCKHVWVEGNYEAGEEDYCSRCIQSRKDIRIAELKAEVKELNKYVDACAEDVNRVNAENARLLELIHEAIDRLDELDTQFAYRALRKALGCEDD